MNIQHHSDRRSFLAALGGMALTPAVWGQTVNSVPAARDWSGNTPLQYPDPDVVALDPRFNKYIVGNTPMRRLYTGTLWSVSALERYSE
jgi:gluconolactonase